MRIGAATITCLLFPMLSHADGKFFRPQTVVTDPNVPAQRAILAYRDGRETLVLESVVDGPGDAFGWVVPLPTEPNEIRTCGAGVFQSLAGLIRPDVGRGPGVLVPISLLLLVAVCFACVSSVLSADRTRARTGRAISFISILICGLLMGYLFLPTLSLVRGIPGVEVMSSTRTGPYEVTVIRGETGQAVLEWLKTNGFASSPEADQVLADYVARQWCFAAARIVRAGASPIRPPPLVVSFLSAEAVYPMRLTGVGLKRLQLDLYVIADRRAAAAGLDTWVSDMFDESSPQHQLTAGFALPGKEFAGRSTRFGLGHPDVTPLMWPGCVLTRLHGELGPSRLAADFSIEWSNNQPYRARVHASEDAWAFAGLPALWIITMSLGVSTWFNIRRSWSCSKLARRVLLPGLVFAAAVGGVTRFSLQAVTTKRDWAGLISQLNWHAHRSATSALPDASPTADLPRLYDALLAKYDYRPSEDADPRLHDVPGGYRIEGSKEGGWVLTVFDPNATPWTIGVDLDGRVMQPGACFGTDRFAPGGPD